MENANKASNTVKEIIKILKSEGARKNGAQGIETNLDVAMITAPEKRDPKYLAKLDAVAGRVLNN